MNKPDWNDAPEWAKYVAMDKDGAWYWYEDEPTKNYGDRWYQHTGKIEDVSFPDDVWEDSLEQNPTKGN